MVASASPFEPVALADGEPSIEESRAFLQERMALLGKILALLSLIFWLVGIGLAVTLAHRSLRQELTDQGTQLHALLTMLMGGAWVLCRRGRRSVASLLLLDASLMLGSAVIVALMAACDCGGQIDVYTAALALGHLLIARGIVVPSTGRRTFWVSVVSALVAIAMLDAYGMMHPETIPPGGVLSFALIGLGMWLAFSTTIAAVASHLIFGLRQEARVAKRIGQYVLKEKLGEGGMGVVYKATHAMLRRETAIKLLPPNKVAPTTLARFEREVRHTAQLSHPNTVAIYDYGRTPDGTFYYAMEYLDGLDLQQLIESCGPLNSGRVVRVLTQVLGSLSEAHEMGLVHRDVKPANIILSERGGEPDIVKVLDFGLVKALSNSGEIALTATEAITGTPLYLAPELIVSPDGVGPASDLYAVAAVGYFLLTGTHVFDGATLMEVCAHHLHSEPQLVSERLGKPVPAQLEALLMQGLAKDPTKRPESARAFRSALLQCEGLEAWSEADARRWWTSHGSRLREAIRSRKHREPIQTGRTVAVDLVQR